MLRALAGDRPACGARCCLSHRPTRRSPVYSSRTIAGFRAFGPHLGGVCAGDRTGGQSAVVGLVRGPGLFRAGVRRARAACVRRRRGAPWRGGGRQDVVRGAVDLAWQSAGGLEQRLDGGRLEQGRGLRFDGPRTLWTCRIGDHRVRIDASQNPPKVDSHVCGVDRRRAQPRPVLRLFEVQSYVPSTRPQRLSGKRALFSFACIASRCR